MVSILFFFNDTATTEIYTLSLHDALPISYSSRPSISGKARLFAPRMILRVTSFVPRMFSGPLLLRRERFYRCGVCLWLILCVNLLHSLDPISPPALLFFRTGFVRPSRTRNGSNRIEITRVVRKTTAPCPRLPLLSQLSP